MCRSYAIQAIQKGRLTITKKSPAEKTFCSSDVEDDETIQKGMESITKNLQTLFPDFELEPGFSLGANH